MRPSHTNYLIFCRLISLQQLVFSKHLTFLKRQIPTLYAPVRYKKIVFLFNLHVLSLSQAFILSQDQTHRFGTVYYYIRLFFNLVQKRVLPAAGSPTATLLRLHISHNTCSNIVCSTHLMNNTLYICLCVAIKYFVQISLPLCDGRCVQGLDTNSP